MELRRKLNALSGLFETADDQFDRLRDERTKYSAEIKKQITEKGPDFLKQEINLDNLIEYLIWRFPNRKMVPRENVAKLLSDLTKFGYKYLNQIDDTVTSVFEGVKAYEKMYPPTNVKTGQKTIFSQEGVVRVALGVRNEEYRKEKGVSAEFVQKVLEFQSSAKK